MGHTYGHADMLIHTVLLYYCLGHVYIVLEPVGSARLTSRVLMYRSLFGVPDVITDMTRSLEMLET